MTKAEELRNVIRSIAKPTFEFDYTPGALSAADARAKGLTPIKGIVSCGMNPTINKSPAYGSFRGRKIKVKTASNNNELAYSLSTNNLTRANMGILMASDPDYDFSGDGGADNTRSAIAAVAGTAFNFDEGSSGVKSNPENWYHILDGSGVHQRNLTAVSFIGSTAGALTENVDYYLDLEAGLVQFVTEYNAETVTPTLTADEITADSTDLMERIAPGTKFLSSGYGTLRGYDEDDNSRLIFEHELFACQVSSDGSTTFEDDFGTIPIMVDILDGSTFLVRK